MEGCQRRGVLQGVPLYQQERRVQRHQHHQGADVHQYRRGAGHYLLLQGGGPERGRQVFGLQRGCRGQGRSRAGGGLFQRQREAPADMEGRPRRDRVSGIPLHPAEQRV